MKARNLHGEILSCCPSIHMPTWWTTEAGPTLLWGILGTRTPWYPGSQQQARGLGLSIRSGTTHKDSQLCLPLSPAGLGCASPSQTPTVEWCLFSQIPYSKAMSPLRYLLDTSSHGELTATLTHLPQAAASRVPSRMLISRDFWAGRPHLASA